MIGRRRRDPAPSLAGRRVPVAGLAAVWNELAAQLAPLERQRRRLRLQISPLALLATLACLAVAVAVIWLMPAHLPYLLPPGVGAVLIAWASLWQWLDRPLARLRRAVGDRVAQAAAVQAGLRPVADAGVLAARFAQLDPPAWSGDGEAAFDGMLAGRPIRLRWGRDMDGPALLVLLPAAAPNPATVLLRRARGASRWLPLLLERALHPRRPPERRRFTLTYWIMAPARGSAATLLPEPLRALLLRLAARLGRAPAATLEQGDLLLALPLDRHRWYPSVLQPFDSITVLASALDLMDLLRDLAASLPACDDPAAPVDHVELTP